MKILDLYTRTAVCFSPFTGKDSIHLFTFKMEQDSQVSKQHKIIFCRWAFYQMMFIFPHCVLFQLETPAVNLQWAFMEIMPCLQPSIHPGGCGNLLKYNKLVVKNSPANAGDTRDVGSIPR